MAMYPPCQKCGVCCCIGPCDSGKPLRRWYGICKYLVKQKDGKMACKLILKGEIPKNIGFGKGCILRAKGDLIWAIYKDMAMSRLRDRFG
jgi:hypothetical protein